MRPTEETWWSKSATKDYKRLTPDSITGQTEAQRLRKLARRETVG